MQLLKYLSWGFLMTAIVDSNFMLIRNGGNTVLLQCTLNELYEARVGLPIYFAFGALF